MMFATSTSRSSSAAVIPFPPRGAFVQEEDDLFRASSSTMASTGIVGLIIKTAERPCRNCGAIHFIIGSSAAMHCARLTCAECGAFGGWLSKGRYRYASMILEKFGPAALAAHKD